MDSTIDNGLWQRMLHYKVVRFFLSAGVGFIVDATVYFLVYNYLFEKRDFVFLSFNLTGDVSSLVISFTAGVITNFLITKYLVFTESDLAAYRQFIRFALVAILGFFANLLVLKLLVHYLNFYPPLARVSAALSLGTASYFIHRAFSFNIKKDE